MRPIFRIIIRNKGKYHCKIKVQSQHVEELGRTVDSPMKWEDDEFVNPNLSQDHKDPQLIPRESSPINHETTPSSKIEKRTIYYQGEGKGLIKNLPTLRVLTHLCTALKSTQIKGPVKVIVKRRDSISKEREGKPTLMRNSEKAHNLDKIIRKLHLIKEKGVTPF